MENENFDEDLKNRIKQIFDDYDDSQANEGWNLLREKYPEKKRDYFFWWISSAAVLLLMALLFWFFQPEIYKPKSVKNIKQFKSDSTKIQVKVYSSSKKPIIKTNSNNINSDKKILLKTVSDFDLKQKVTSQKNAVIKSTNIESDRENNYDNTVFTDAKLASTDNPNRQMRVSNLEKVDSLQPKKLQPIVQTQNTSIKPAPKKEPIKIASIKKSLSKLSNFNLSIYAGPHINFANGSNNQLGFGAGFSTDFSLSKKLKISSGLGLIANKLVYKNSSNSNLLAASPAYQLANSTQIIITNTSLNSLTASLLQLDIPINLIYNILPGKNSISVLTGLSSGTFAKESYQYNYANTTNNLQSSKSFQSFYLLKALNIAAQFGLPINKYNLQVEPFVKVPLGNLTTQQLKFGAAGINLKFNFQPIKK